MNLGSRGTGRTLQPRTSFTVAQNFNVAHGLVLNASTDLVAVEVQGRETLQTMSRKQTHDLRTSIARSTTISPNLRRAPPKSSKLITLVLLVLTNLFATTFSADTNARKAAEVEIKNAGQQEGMIAALLQIIANNNVDLTTRQAMVVWLKNRVVNGYAKDSSTPIPPSDRVAVKHGIVPLLIAAPSRPIRVQFAAIIKAIINEDFPDQWPELLPTIATLLTSEDLAAVYGGLLIILEIAKTYKFVWSLPIEARPVYKTLSKEKVFIQIIEKTFPTLVTLGQKFTSANPPISPLEGAEFLHIILKTYVTSIYSGLSKHQQTSESIVPWGTLLFQTINLQLPAGVVLPGDKTDWEKHAWWKAKKWSYRTLNRLFERYGSPTHIPKPMKKQYGDFAKNFVTTFAPEIFGVYLKQIELFIENQVWMSDKCLNLVFNFFGFCVKPKTTWEMLKPHAQTIVSRLVFPQLRFDHSKAELYEHDPVEYVREGSEDFEDYGSPRAAAVGFVHTLATTRTKTAFMGILELVNQALKGTGQVPPAPEDKFAALQIVIALAEVIMKNEEVKPAMETFVITYVLPEFSSNIGFMREIACQVVERLSAWNFEWKDPKVLACFDETEEVDPRFLEIQELIIPIVTATLNSQVIELYDQAWEFVDNLTFRSRKIVPNMWPIYKITYDLFKGSAIDYLDEMLPPLCNFLMFGKEAFIQTPEYIRMALDIFITSLTNDHLGDVDAINGFKLVEAVLLNLKGHVNDAVPTIINATVTRMAKSESPNLQIAGLDTIINSIYYNPVLTLQALEQAQGGARAFFDKWFAAMNSPKGLPRVHDKKLSILALCELMKMDTSAVPQTLTEGWSGLVAGALAIFKELPEAEDRRAALLEEYEDDSGEEDMEEDLVVGPPADDEDGDVFDEETAYLDMLAEEHARLRAKQAKRVAKLTQAEGAIAGDDDEDGEYVPSESGSDDSDETVPEDFSVETVIDEVDAYSYFKQTLTGLQTSNPALYQAVTTSLNVDQQTDLMEVMNHEEEAEVVVPSS
ncbi:hypothetical protein M407DRAFT_8258 [Tulasnella calospora MUT 4182]|uniref:Importin N-terminal domain-containing protein n=1 Tax=Tulasnella calospora MUT 4182 TaxID=1051891 RepID=A0A0C3Q7R5_9AGAM|nr:hypothetical protein M407DRAFT_8258 [Tulasnella calospora MUT 4182]